MTACGGSRRAEGERYSMMPSARQTWMISSCVPGGPSITLPSSTLEASPPVSDRAIRSICASNTDSISARAARQVITPWASAVTSTASSSSSVRRARSERAGGSAAGRGVVAAMVQRACIAPSPAGGGLGWGLAACPSKRVGLVWPRPHPNPPPEGEGERNRPPAPVKQALAAIKLDVFTCAPHSFRPLPSAPGSPARARSRSSLRPACAARRGCRPPPRCC